MMEFIGVGVIIGLEFIFTVHSQTENYVEMISQSHSGKSKHATI